MIRLLENGDFAIIRMNFLDQKTCDAPLVITADMLGIPEEKAMTMKVTDLWTGEKVELVNGTIPNHGLNAHGCQVYRVHLED